MDACQLPLDGDLPGLIPIDLDADDLTFDHALREARKTAGSRYPNAMLISWFDRKRGVFSPSVHCCTDRPGWVDYAVSRGGNLTVDVNHHQYVFIFGGGPEFE